MTRISHHAKILRGNYPETSPNVVTYRLQSTSYVVDYVRGHPIYLSGPSFSWTTCTRRRRTSSRTFCPSNATPLPGFFRPKPRTS
ncbi:unnamed protein product, partial [Pylaiella littoralis]